MGGFNANRIAEKSEYKKNKCRQQQQDEEEWQKHLYT